MTPVFFNFTFDLIDGQVIWCRLNWRPIDTIIWKEIYLIKEKYDEKNEKYKRRKKMFDKKQKKYCEDMEARIIHKKHLQEHIQKAEAKLCEYKNTILAFGKLASCNSLSK